MVYTTISIYRGLVTLKPKLFRSTTGKFHSWLKKHRGTINRLTVDPSRISTSDQDVYLCFLRQHKSGHHFLSNFQDISSVYLKFSSDV